MATHRETVDPDQNKRMRQLLPYHSFLVCFVVVGKVPFFNDRLRLCKRLVLCFYRRFLMIPVRQLSCVTSAPMSKEC